MEKLTTDIVNGIDDAARLASFVLDVVWSTTVLIPFIASIKSVCVSLIIVCGRQSTISCMWATQNWK